MLIVLVTSLLCGYLIYQKIKLERQSRIFNLLLKVNEIIVSTATDLDQVVQKISDAVAFELKFKVGVVFLIDNERGVLKRVAVSRTKLVEQAVNKIGKQFQGLETPLSCNQNLAVQVAKDGKYRVTHNLYDVLVPHFTAEDSNLIQEIGKVRSTLIFPVNSQNRRLGVMIISLDQVEKDLPQEKIELIERLINFIGIALNNALLYKNLQETTNQLNRANLRLKELDQLKDDFVSVASHELRTPMTAIRSYSWMALNRPDITLSEKMKKYLSRTLISTERLINLVNDMLNVSRIEAGRIEIRPQIFDIQTLVDDVIAEVTPKANEKMVRLEVIKANLPKVFADPDKVHQVLLNLIGNSLKFTPTDGLIEVNFLSDGKAVEISVKDNGVGISKEDLSRLFQKFGRLDNSYVAAATSGGTGLGLYISKSLVELMHGTIKVSSEGVGKGATFTFSLPIATPEIVVQIEKYTRQAVGEAKPLEPVAL